MLRERHSDARICAICGEPVERIGSEYVRHDGTVGFSPEPIMMPVDHASAYTSERQVYARGKDGGSSRTIHELQLTHLCTRTDYGHFKSPSCGAVPIGLTRQSTEADLPEWCRV